jgi:hypothetical protein
VNIGMIHLGSFGNVGEGLRELGASGYGTWGTCVLRGDTSLATFQAALSVLQGPNSLCKTSSLPSSGNRTVDLGGGLTVTGPDNSDLDVLASQLSNAILAATPTATADYSHFAYPPQSPTSSGGSTPVITPNAPPAITVAPAIVTTPSATAPSTIPACFPVQGPSGLVDSCYPYAPLADQTYPIGPGAPTTAPAGSGITQSQLYTSVLTPAPTVNSFTDWMTQQALTGVPNWVLVVGAGLALYLAKGKGR